MNLNALRRGPIRLYRFAEAIARRLAEKHEGLYRDEALLRAAIAWARFARDRYNAVLERAKDSEKARILVDPARKRCIRADQLLRRRLTSVIARKCEFMREAQARQRAAGRKDERLLSVANFALSLRT